MATARARSGSSGTADPCARRGAGRQPCPGHPTRRRAGARTAQPARRCAVAAAVILTVWSHPGRIRSEAAFASITGTRPIPASSGNTARHRVTRAAQPRAQLGPATGHVDQVVHVLDDATISMNDAAIDPRGRCSRYGDQTAPTWQQTYERCPTTRRLHQRLDLASDPVGVHDLLTHDGQVSALIG